MGRKKGQSKPKQILDSNYPAVTAIEVLAEILETSGLWVSSDEDQSPWGNMITSLEVLDDNLDMLDKSNDVGSILLTVEEHAEIVRSLAPQALSHERKKASIMMDLCHDLQNVCQDNHIIRLQPIALLLLASVRRQSLAFQEVVEQVEQELSLLYTNTSIDGALPKSNKSNRFRKAASNLKRKCIDRDKSPWKDAIELLQNFGSESDLMLSASQQTLETDGTYSRHIGDLAAAPHLHSKKEFNSSGIKENVFDVVIEFIDQKEDLKELDSKCILLVGPEGSGKTFAFDEIERLVPLSMNVIRPSLPFDGIGLTVGSTEDLLISMVTAAKASPLRSILLIDDIESICGHVADESSITTKLSGNTTGVGEPHMASRIRSLLLSLLDAVQSMTGGNSMMLICSAKNDWRKSVDRFDQTFVLRSPTKTERREFLCKCVLRLNSEEAMGSQTEALLSNAIDFTAGVSYAELTQHCREALLRAILEKTGPIGFFAALKRRTQESIPESLKTGMNSSFMDMNILTSRDLNKISRNTDQASDTFPTLPLYGERIEAAWEELNRLIIIPICEAKALHSIMFHNDSSGGKGGGKVFAGGVLLAGSPGCGKTALAYHCAAVASTLNPSVKLLDVSCTSLIHKEVGSSEQAIHQLFQSAKSSAPCILLLDGIENIAAVRGNDNTTEGTMDRVLSTMLTELDGVDSEQFSPENPACLAIIGITHDPRWVDPALKRPGRLERVIELDPPEAEARRRIVERELRWASETGTADSIEVILELVASRTEGFSGADVVAVCNEAKMLGSRDAMKGDQTEQQPLKACHFESAIDIHMAGKSNP